MVIAGSSELARIEQWLQYLGGQMPRAIPSFRTPRVETTSRHRDYDRFARDREAAAFYHSARWRLLRRMKLRRNPLCERCEAKGLTVAGVIVHHRIERREERELELELTNLESLCRACHGGEHGSHASRGPDASTGVCATTPGGGGTHR